MRFISEFHTQHWKKIFATNLGQYICFHAVFLSPCYSSNFIPLWGCKEAKEKREKIQHLELQSVVSFFCRETTIKFYDFPVPLKSWMCSVPHISCSCFESFFFGWIFFFIPCFVRHVVFRWRNLRFAIVWYFRFVEEKKVTSFFKPLCEYTVYP